MATGGASGTSPMPAATFGTTLLFLETTTGSGNNTVTRASPSSSPSDAVLVVVGIDGGPRCKHAFAYGGGGLLVLQYLPNILFITNIVYVALCCPGAHTDN